MNHFLASDLSAIREAVRRHAARDRKVKAAQDRELLLALLSVGMRCGEDDAEIVLDLLLGAARQSMFLESRMNNVAWVYIQSEPGLYTVGFYDPQGKWHADSDYSTQDEAAARCAWLNGGAADFDARR